MGTADRIEQLKMQHLHDQLRSRLANAEQKIGFLQQAPSEAVQQLDKVLRIVREAGIKHPDIEVAEMFLADVKLGGEIR